MFRLDNFYRSKEWINFRFNVINERMSEDGYIYDEVTHKPILRAYDLILHHKTELTDENVNDYNISLNPDNIMIVSHKTHNIIHDNFNTYRRQQVFLVYGAPLSGKTSWVNENKGAGDLVVDINNIWQCVSGEANEKNNRLKGVVFKIRDTALEAVRYRLGKWNNAYIVGGYPLQSDRERLLNEMGAREIFIDVDRATCEQRAETTSDPEQTKQYIAEWFERFEIGKS